MFVDLVKSKTRAINPEHIITAELVKSDLYKPRSTGSLAEQFVKADADTEAILLDLTNGKQVLVASIENILLARTPLKIYAVYDPEIFNGLKNLLFA